MPAEISVVIPAYNAEKHIKKCLESIKNQTFHNFEVIVVIDGATDATENIARSFAEADSRFGVIVQDNAGPSGAKNNGIHAANGKYITFVDSDDYVEPNHLQVLYDAIGDTALSVCGFVNEESNATLKSHPDIQQGRMSGEEILDRLIISKNAVGGSNWNKLYLRGIIDENKILFYTGHKYMFEDVLFNYEYIKHISEGVCVSDYTYHYVHHKSEGMSRGLTDLESKWMHYTDLLDAMLAENDEKYSKFLKKVSLAKVWHCATAVRVLAHYGKTKNEKYREMRRYIGKNLPRYLLCRALPIKKRLGGLLTFFFPEFSFALWDKSR